MAKNTPTLDELKKIINSLSYIQLKQLVEEYSDAHAVSFETEMENLITTSLQEKLIKLGINSTCPHCSSSKIVKNGTRGDIQLFKCKDCNKKFTPFTNTILEKSHWHWDIWVKVVEMVINNYPIETMMIVLEDDYGCVGINYKTVWRWRMKIIHALASLPQPVLTGIVQIDETFIRESQKGSRELVSYLGKDYERKPRYGHKPSKLGSMSPEFATVVAAVDNRGYCVCKVAALGKLTKSLFMDLFEPHLKNVSFLCTDGNDAYDGYCDLLNVPHYVLPSRYHKIISDAGYETPGPLSSAAAKLTKEKNDKILHKLYRENMIDRIANRGTMTYDELVALKKQNGLSLGRVNEFHKDIKLFINGTMRNVSTKYLQDYLGYFTYIRNWRVKNGKYPSSSKEAETIFIEILKAKVNYTTTKIDETELELPKPSSRYITLLEEETEKARKASQNKYFKFGEEDGVKTFNKRDYLLDQPTSKLYEIAKECKIRHYKQLARWSLVSEILKQPNASEIIYKLLESDRHYKIDEEDLKLIKAGKYI